MAKKKKNIDLENQRYGLFMNENSFNLDIMYGRHYLDRDVNYFVRIFKMNIIETKKHNLYGQAKAKDKKYLTPVQLNAMVTIEENRQENYGNNEGGIVREDTGNIIVNVYLQELEEKKIEVDRGDIIEYNQSGDRPRYYEVESANNVVDSTSQTIAGFKPYWKRIVGVPVKEDVTPFLNGDSLR